MSFSEGICMKTSPLLVMAAVFLSAATLRPQSDVDAGDSAKTTYAANAGGFGDAAASRSWEMTSVTGELDGKLDTKSAKLGDRVVLKTTDKAQLPDGTILPRGSRLVGHVTEVQAHSSDRAIAQLGIAFDHAELKNGESIPVHSLIRTVRMSASVSSMNVMGNDGTMDASAIGTNRIGSGMGSGRGGGGIGGGVGAGGGIAGDAGNLGAGTAGGVAGGTAGGTLDRNGIPTNAGAGVGTGADAGALGASAGAHQDSAVQLSGHGDAPISGGAHAAAAQRSVPHPTGIPGVMLAGSSTSSGLLIEGDRKEIEFTSGTRFEMGVVGDR
jgi:hypothetical protein